MISMNLYLVVTIMFILGFSSMTLQHGYSAYNQNNSFSYYEKNCNNDSCTVTTCNDDQPCTAIGPTTENNALLETPRDPIIESEISDDYGIIDWIKDFLN